MWGDEWDIWPYAIAMNWKDKTVLITGGNSGIGEAISDLLARWGMRVVISGRRTERNEAVAERLRRRHGAEVMTVEGDVAKEGDCRRMVAAAGEAFGRLDLLINNAGKGAMNTRIVDSDSETFDRVLKTNLYSAYWCTREAWPLLERNEAEDANGVRGAVINISSLAGVDAWAGTGIYAASKHGMMGLTKALADEGAEARIRVAAICPALVATPMTGVSGSDYIAPEDIAATVGYLISLRSAAWPTEVVVPRRGVD